MEKTAESEFAAGVPAAEDPVKGSAAEHGPEKSGAAMISIISNTCLTLLKLVAGLLTGSVAIVSEAVHSGMDLAAAIMAYISVRVAERPADAGHPFGHGKAEHLAALFEGLLIVAAGALIIRQAVIGFTSPEFLPALGWGVLVMLASAIVNILVSRFLFQVGARTESAALIADAWHLRTDVYTSMGVFAALGLIMLGRRLAPETGLDFLDPLCAGLVALMILKTGVKLTCEAVSYLLDRSLSREELILIKKHIEMYAPCIVGYGDIKTRRSGSCRLVFMELIVDGAMSVEEAHAMGEHVAESIRDHFPDSQISFHLEPRR
ncbi:MAG: cation diffusion facilitator family transporter [Candidatus Adiutrix sp.]|jgi:cation diffusion facilitator family transporter|nr:cation diffusion facilitator family transporter [Candidatus Adiutrix sp.]